MSKIDDGGAAFPSGLNQDAGYMRQFCYPMNDGMSLRQWYAGLAMQALASAIDEHGHWTGADAIGTAQHAVKMADALIAAFKE